MNPLSYEVDALRGLLFGSPRAIATDLAVLAAAGCVGIAVGSSLLPRLAY